MINFYFDTITDKGPVPNGHEEYYLYDSVSFPVGKYSHYPTKKITNFYYTLKKFNIDVTLYTKNYTAPDLFYPLELNQWYSEIKLSDVISIKARKFVKRKNLQILLLAQDFVGYTGIMQIKQSADDLVNIGIPADKIKIVTGDLTHAYKSLLLPYTSFSMDWWQVESQLILKGDKIKYKYIPPPRGFETTDLKYGNETTFNLITTDGSLHALSLTTEVLYNNLHKDNAVIYKHGEVIYDKTDERIVDRFENQIVKKDKQNLAKTLLTKGCKYDKNKSSLIEVIFQDFAAHKNDYYMDEVYSIHTDFTLWKAVASGKPFIVFGSHQIMRYLNNQGYFSFYEIVNEEYDRVLDYPQRSKAIVNQLLRINKMTKEEKEENMKAIEKFVETNKLKFLNRDHLSTFLSLFDKIRNNSAPTKTS